MRFKYFYTIFSKKIELKITNNELPEKKYLLPIVIFI